MLSEFCPACFRVLFCSVVPPADPRLKLLDRVVSGARFLTGMCLSEILLIIDLSQYCICCLRSCITRFPLFMVLYLCRMCQCGLHAVIWSHIHILMRLLTAEDRSTAGPLFPSQCPPQRFCRPFIRWCGTGGFQEQVQFFSIDLSCSIIFCLLLPFLFSSLCLEIGILGWGFSD